MEMTSIQQIRICIFCSPETTKWSEFWSALGYVTAGPKTGRALFYYLAESSNSPSTTKPLVLRLNGGPSCSSFGIGATTELQTYNCRNLPPVLDFLTQNTASDYITGDTKTATDSYTLIMNWSERFPPRA
ncbi:unnamed protein product [Coffea canephora]|uniref:Uncharacterized protein n=1 Tax=Coffea canephora TaxID=49390 RepID=A0A068TMI1_COFCA|nr:unnamed protein product [Coffea canephora]